jgi:5-methylthioribose kinase
MEVRGKIMKFTTYFTMNEDEAAIYASEKLKDIFGENSRLSCKEIGDGNLNYIFRIVDEISGRSIIIKQSGPVARISDEFKLSPDRNRIEYEILKLEEKLAPGLVPKVYVYDPIMNCTVMDDLSDHQIMRKALMEFKIFPRFAQDISDFMVNTLLLTTDVVLEHKNKKEMVKNFINPQLCEITEDLVYTEPFSDVNRRNDVFEPNRAWVKEHIYDSLPLRLETAKLKFEFMNHAQALVHGDLHTGSVFVNETSTKVIDPEFAFFGPIGYDVGNVIANLIFAWVHSDAHQQFDHKRWLEETIIETVDLFIEKFNRTWDIHVSEFTAKTLGFKEYYLSSVLRDTAGVCGLELCRRIIGLAHVKDITSLVGEMRVRAERICLIGAKDFILKRDQYICGADFLETMKIAMAGYGVNVHE